MRWLRLGRKSMAKTNAFVCDRCGKATNQSERYQIKARWRVTWSSYWDKPLDLCGSCFIKMREFMMGYEPIDPKELKGHGKVSD